MTTVFQNVPAAYNIAFGAAAVAFGCGGMLSKSISALLSIIKARGKFRATFGPITALVLVHMLWNSFPRQHKL